MLQQTYSLSVHILIIYIYSTNEQPMPDYPADSGYFFFFFAYCILLA
jgi:hypothetical protein